MMKGLEFAFGDQVVDDQPRAPLPAPASLIFPATVLQIQHGITHRRVLFILGRRVNEAAQDRVGALGIVKRLTQLAVRNVLECVEILVVGRNFNAAAPAAGPVEVEAVGIRDLGTVHNDLVVMKAFILGTRLADPRSVVTFGQRILHSADIELDDLCLRRDNAGADSALGIDLGILLARLVACRGFPVGGLFIGLGQAQPAGENENNRKYNWRLPVLAHDVPYRA